MTSEVVTAVSASQLKELIDHTLTDLDGDDLRGPLLQAIGLKVRLEVTDVGLVLRVASSDDADHRLVWDYADIGSGDAGLELRMDSATANAYLQGRESLPVAIARGQARLAGESKLALVYLPALRFMVEPYRRWVGELHPHLALN
jgi:hypothetical protein